MTAYLLSAVGVIFLSVIVSILVPEGKLNKSIVFVMRLCCIFVLIRPIVGVFKIEDKSSGEEFFDYEYVCNVYSENQSGQIEELIYKEMGIETECRVNIEYDGGEFRETAVTVETVNPDEQILDKIYEYLQGLGYINISVYAKTA